MLDFTFSECYGKMVMIKVIEDMDDYSATEYLEINNENDYHLLENVIADYETKGILDEYFIYD